MPKARKRVIDIDNNIRRKRTKSNQLEQSPNPENKAYDSEMDLQPAESQDLVALTEKRVAKSNEVLSNFSDILEIRKTASLGMLGDYAKAIKERERELQNATITMLDSIFPDDRHQHPAFSVTNSLKGMSESNMVKSTAFLRKYRGISHQTITFEDGTPTANNPEDNINHLKSLLERSSGRLRTEIHILLGYEHSPKETHVEDKAEDELWKLFGGVNSTLQHHEGRIGGDWSRSTKNNTRALRRLVKYLPQGD